MVYEEELFCLKHFIPFSQSRSKYFNLLACFVFGEFSTCIHILSEWIATANVQRKELVVLFTKQEVGFFTTLGGISNPQLIYMKKSVENNYFV